ncbi:hypothetical protein AVEN_213877-1 [Araneus ventricosus]|uniref:Uncharacterized protein n=1 Tax=Araneus ventricosus TaxID=182803 RepID=A0A4Y2KL86_ARAVE|nr:hypothetical protein AVEN_213877-1 [Araneus ventricosus]
MICSVKSDLLIRKVTSEDSVFPWWIVIMPQIAILVCSNLALLICKLATTLTGQKCKLETSLRKRLRHHTSNLSNAYGFKLIANCTKNRVRAPPTYLFLNLSL